MANDTRIAIIGTGNVGGNLGQRLTQSGFTVRFGVKGDKDISELLDKCGGKASAHSVADATGWAEVVLLAVPGTVAVDAAKSLGDVSGKVLVDCTNPLRWDAGPIHNPPAEGSNAEAIAKALPDARVLKAFNTFGAEIHLDPKIGDNRADLYFAGDDADAKKTLAAVADAAGFEPVDCGPLRYAASLEQLAMLWIYLAMVGGMKRETAFKLLSR